MLVRLPAEALDVAMNEDPALVRRLAATAAERLAVRTVATATRATTVAVVPAPTLQPGVTSWLCRRLAVCLAADGAAMVVDRSTLVTAEANPRAVLDRIESANRYVVYRAGHGSAAWTSQCVRQADRVLVVLDGRERAEMPVGAIGADAVDLVLMHPHGVEPSGSSAWIDAVRPRRWYHVRAGDDRDVARLARHVQGRAIGLVLGSGGAKGWAHLGVMRALDEAGTEVDAVGGTSIGALLGAFLALGWDDALPCAKARSGLVETKRLLGLTLPLVSVSSASKLTRMLRDDDCFGERRADDLPVPWFGMSANLSRAISVTHDRGPLWWAVRASISIPGVLPPVHDHGELLVDGGALNPLPVDVMPDRIDGTVIAVNLRSGRRTAPIPSFEPAVSGWEVLARRLHPARRPLRLPGEPACMPPTSFWSLPSTASIRWISVVLGRSSGAPIEPRCSRSNAECSVRWRQSGQVSRWAPSAVS